MPSTCDIEFDHPNNVYYSGQDLNGKIRLKTQSTKSVRGVHITVNGYAKVKWDERRTRTVNGKSQSYTVTFSAFDQYLNSRTYIAGREGGNSFEFPPGEHLHSFYCPLPLSLPTSVSGKYGEIKYEVVVTIDRPFRFDNVFKSAFTVIQELNLNLDPIYRTPKHAVDVKDYCCTCCCFGGPGTVNTKLSIPFGGYAPGQKINFSLSVDNESANDLDECKVKLEKCITFESRHPSVKHKYSNFKLHSKYFPQVLRNSRKIFEDYLEIPSVPPSSTFSGACVRISYTVYATIVTGCCHSNIQLQIPIVMGTIPLVESATNPNNVIILQPTAPSNLDDINNGDSPPGYKIAAPPSYEDATAIALDTFVDNEKDDKHQEAPFIPKYPVYYNFAQPPLPNTITNGLSGNFALENRPSTSTTYGWTPN